MLILHLEAVKYGAVAYCHGSPRRDTLPALVDFLLAQVTDLKDAAPLESQTLDSAILGEQFYFFTVVLMWLIHVGFMTYETGVARRKNALATAMKNILTIAVVTPTMYYIGWWIYNCNQPGIPPIGPNSSDFTSVACQGGIPWSDAFGPNLTNNINLDLLPRLPAVLVDDRIDHVRGAARAGASLRVPAARCACSAPSSGSWMPPGAGAPAAGSRCASAFTTRLPPRSCTASPAPSRSVCSSTSDPE